MSIRNEVKAVNEKPPETRTPEKPRPPIEKPREAATPEAQKPKTPKEMVSQPNPEMVHSKIEPKGLPKPGAERQVEKPPTVTKAEKPKEPPPPPHAELAARAEMTKERFDQVRDTPRGSRPEPSTYLNEKYVAKHLEQFQTAHRNQSEVMKYGIGRMEKAPSDPRLEQGRAFVTPFKTEKVASDTGPKPVHIEMTGLDKVKPKMPSGNESAANKEWVPGGRDAKAGVPEAVLDLSDRPINRLIRKDSKG